MSPGVAPGSVRIFDTTLRDGEQAPGAGLTAAEKLEVARQLARLHVDVIEAGFPAASPGDFEAVRRIAQETKGGIAVAALARCRDGDPQRAIEAIGVAEKPHLHGVLPRLIAGAGQHVLARRQQYRRRHRHERDGRQRQRHAHRRQLEHAEPGEAALLEEAAHHQVGRRADQRAHAADDRGV